MLRINENGSYTGLGGAANSQGQVQFDLAAGQYQIRVDYLGYQFWSELYDVSAAVSDVFHIPHQDLAVTVNGVLDTAEPLAGLPVYLFTETGQYLSQKLTTNAAGQVVFTLPDKAFKVRVDYMGQQFWSQPFTAQPASVPIPMADAQVLVSPSPPRQTGPLYTRTAFRSPARYVPACRRNKSEW